MAKKVKKTREEWKVWGNVFDSFTEHAINKLISQGRIDGLKSPISIGKESNIFTAQSRNGDVIVKIYRVQSCNFNKMYSYIRPDPRFHGIKPRRRQVILAWVQREFRNLFEARKAGVTVPKPIAIVDNAIVMELIGKGEPAPKLKDALPSDLKSFFEKTVHEMKLMHKARLVHGDLSEFNILNYNDVPVLIDFSQATVFASPNSEELLIRDAKNVANFFVKKGVRTTAEDILKRIRA